MEPEPVLDELITALQQLRAQMIQVKASEHSENELAEINLGLRGTFIGVLAINSRLETSRMPDDLDHMEAGLQRMDQSIALTKAVRAIDPDYLPETIDAAICLAESQR